MEISNDSHFSTDAYLLSQRKHHAEQQDISPLKQITQDNKERPEQTPETAKQDDKKNSDRDSDKNWQVTETNPFQSFQLKKAKNYPPATATEKDQSRYKVTAHDVNMPRHAEKAVNSYNMIENSQDGQELVNRIELMV